MPHLIKETHLEDLCASCKKPHGNNVTLLHQKHKIYEIISCTNCGYESIRIKAEKDFASRGVYGEIEYRKY